MNTPNISEALDVRRASMDEGPRPRVVRFLLDYDTGRWPFARALTREVFRVRQLHKLHQFLAEKKRRLGCEPTLGYDDNLAMRKLIQDLPDDSLFFQLYHHFMSKVLSPLVGLPLSYSGRPKLRVHLAGTPGVSSFHDDSSVTGRADQMNIWMPFTDVAGTATLWVESARGLGDYSPIDVRYGQFLVFDGGFLRHGTVANTTETTRVSLDTRFAFKGASTRADGLALLDRLLARSGGRRPGPPVDDAATDPPGSGTLTTTR